MEGRYELGGIVEAALNRAMVDAEWLEQVAKDPALPHTNTPEEAYAQLESYITRVLADESAAEDRMALDLIAAHLNLTGMSSNELAQQVLVLCAYMLYEGPKGGPGTSAGYHILRMKEMGYPSLPSLLAGHPDATHVDPDDAPMLLTHLANAVLREDPHFFYHAGRPKLALTRGSSSRRNDIAKRIASTLYAGHRLTALSRFDLAALLQHYLAHQGEDNEPI